MVSGAQNAYLKSIAKRHLGGLFIVMSDKTFHHHDEEWTASYVGAGHGVGTRGANGEMPPITRHQTHFRRSSDDHVTIGWIGSSDPSSVADEQLQIALDIALGRETE